jgi:hypothetical protein
MRSAIVACLAAMLLACGSNGGLPDDDGGSDGDGGTIAPDATLSDTGGGGTDATLPTDTGAPIIDASLDIAFPDAFTVPEGGGGADGGGADAGCSPSGVRCEGTNPVFAVTCANGVETSVNCTAQGKQCADGFGCVTCQPGSGTCSGAQATRCKPDGSGFVTETCDPLLGLSCTQGICTGACANIGQSYIGCDYYAVTMSNPALSQSTFFFAVSISNTGQQAATVTITGPSNYTSTLNVAANAVQTVQLPWVSSLSTAYGTVRADGAAYRIRSTQPVTVYQFNARDYQIGSSYSYTNDASLLLPANAMTGSYRVATQPTWRFSSGTQYPGLVTIVGTENGTQVQFTAPASGPVQAGAGIAATGTSTVTLNRGDVLQIGSALNAPGSNTYGSDPTGATVVADKPVEVFGGSACTFTPANVGYCDHTEEIQFPTETLRSDYLVVPPNNVSNMSVSPRHFVKIVATAPNTTLTYDPPQSGAPTTLATAGAFGQFLSTQAFRVTANNPIVVATYMLGQDNFSTSSNVAGDPSLGMGVATAQYRTDYRFFAPPNYMQNWVTVVAPMNATVTVDGVAVGALTAIGASGYGFRYVSLCANNAMGCTGVHAASGSAPFGIQVYGYGSYTSYMYPGGLDLKR